MLFFDWEWEWEFRLTRSSHSKSCTLVGLKVGVGAGVGVGTRRAHTPYWIILCITTLLNTIVHKSITALYCA